MVIEESGTYLLGKRHDFLARGSLSWRSLDWSSVETRQ